MWTCAATPEEVRSGSHATHEPFLNRIKKAGIIPLSFIHQSSMKFWRLMTSFTLYSFMILLSRKKFSSFFYLEKGAETKQQLCWLSWSSIKSSSSSKNHHWAPRHGPQQGVNHHRAQKTSSSSDERTSELEEVDDYLPLKNLHDLDVSDEVDDNFELDDDFQYTKSCLKLSMYFDDRVGVQLNRHRASKSSSRSTRSWTSSRASTPKSSSTSVKLMNNLCLHKLISWKRE